METAEDKKDEAIHRIHQLLNKPLESELYHSEVEEILKAIKSWLEADKQTLE